MVKCDRSKAGTETELPFGNPFQRLPQNFDDRPFFISTLTVYPKSVELPTMEA